MQPLDPKFSAKCVQCADPYTNVEEAKLCLFVTDHTKIVLRLDQAFLGRSVLVPRTHIPKGCNPFINYFESAMDLETCKQRMFDLLEKAFGMTYDNQAQLGNLTRDENDVLTENLNYFHQHQHYIPRYSKPVTWNGESYLDEHFGSAFNIDPKRGHTPLMFSKEKIQLLKEFLQLKMIEEKAVKWDELAPTLPTERVRQAAIHAGLLNS